jgi:hypothetical protein
MNSYRFLDYFFLILHLALVMFNLFGWIWKVTRKANLILLIITGSSWFILGIFYGIGYCPLTDWHWRVLEKLGNMPFESSYMQYLLHRLFGLQLHRRFVDIVTFLSYLAALGFSIRANLYDWRKLHSIPDRNDPEKGLLK